MTVDRGNFATGDGGYYKITDDSGPYTIDTAGKGQLVRDYFTDVGFGLVSGHSRVTLLGHNPDIDTSTTPEDFWCSGGLYPWITTAGPLELISDSANDTATGTGARTVTLNCLDTSGNQMNVVVIMNGTSASLPTINIWRINGFSVTTAGSGGINAGTITIRDSGAGATRGMMLPNVGISRQCVWTTPTGYSLQINSTYICINNSIGSANFTCASYFRTSAGVKRFPFLLSCAASTPYRHDGIPGIMVPAGTDFSWQCTFTSTNNIDASVACLGILRQL